MSVCDRPCSSWYYDVRRPLGGEAGRQWASEQWSSFLAPRRLRGAHKKRGHDNRWEVISQFDHCGSHSRLKVLLDSLSWTWSIHLSYGTIGPLSVVLRRLPTSSRTCRPQQSTEETPFLTMSHHLLRHFCTCKNRRVTVGTPIAFRNTESELPYVETHLRRYITPQDVRSIEERYI